jgi:predicted nucleic acid-binding protein
MQCARFAWSVAPKRRPTRSDARGAGYQHFVSALLVQLGHPAAIYQAWQDGYFTLLICTPQLDELWATLHKPTIAARIKPYKAGRLVNELKDLAENVGSLPRVELSLDPTDDFLLALSEAGKADYLVTQATRAGCLRFAATKSRGSYPPAILPPCSDDSRGQGANYRLTTTGGVEKTTGSFWLVSMVGLRSSF